MHMQSTELFYKLLDANVNCGDLVGIAASYNTKEKRAKLGSFLITNRDNIYDILKYTESHEIQMHILKITSKTLTKKQITQCHFFKNLSKRSTEIPTYKFLVEFNFLFNRNIIGSNFTEFKCIEKNAIFKGGAIFIQEDSLRLYAQNNLVILYNSSILSMKIESLALKIKAKDNKNVSIQFSSTENYQIFITRIKEIYANKFVVSESVDLNQMSLNFHSQTKPAENSIDKSASDEKNASDDLRSIKNILSQQKLVTFNPLKNETRVINLKIPSNQLASSRESGETESTTSINITNCIKNTIPPQKIHDNKEDTLEISDNFNSRENENTISKTSSIKIPTVKIHSPDKITELSSTLSSVDSTSVDSTSISSPELSSSSSALDKIESTILSNLTNHTKRRRSHRKSLRKTLPKRKKTKKIFSEETRVKIDEWFSLYRKVCDQQHKNNLKKAKNKKKQLLTLLRTQYKKA